MRDSIRDCRHRPGDPDFADTARTDGIELVIRNIKGVTLMVPYPARAGSAKHKSDGCTAMHCSFELAIPMHATPSSRARNLGRTYIEIQQILQATRASAMAAERARFSLNASPLLILATPKGPRRFRFGIPGTRRPRSIGYWLQDFRESGVLEIARRRAADRESLVSKLRYGRRSRPAGQRSSSA